MDLRAADLIPELELALSRPKLRLVQCQNITENVIQALDKIQEHKINLIREYTPKRIQPVFKDFAGVRDSKIYNAFKNGKVVYLAKYTKKQ